jgi:dipeptidyl aminopeptidase/acylaminoacyl peptidase
MNLERDLPDVLAHIGASRTPDYRDDIVERIAGVRQRPAWTIPERWLLVDVATTRVIGPRLPSWRVLAIAALVIVALLAAVISIGATRPHLPAPYGPAGNGLMTWTVGGHINVGDPVSGATRTIVTSDGIDVDPLFSFDGSKVAFLRRDDAGLERLMLADPDGSDLRVLTPTPIHDRQGWEWAGDGRSFVLTSDIDGLETLSVVDVGTATTHPLDLGMDIRDAFYAPPTGTSIAFLAPRLASQARIYLVDNDGTNVRALTSPITSLSAPAWSPDGRWIAYSGHDDTLKQDVVHVVAADGSSDRVIPNPPDVDHQGDPSWSPDGRSLLVGRTYTVMPAGSTRLDAMAIIPVDGSGPGRDIGGPNVRAAGGGTWSPDGRSIVYEAWNQPETLVVIDVASGTARPLPFPDIVAYPSWQRVAP